MQRLAKEYEYLSRPVEELIRGHQCESGTSEDPPSPDQIAGSGYIHCPTSEPGIAACDVLIVGSGYGGAIAASVLADAKASGQNRPLRVIVLERGKEFAPGEFPESLGDLPGEVRFHRHEDDDFIGDADALFDFRVNKDVSVLVANGLGGGSLINGNVALRPDKSSFTREAWPAELRKSDALDAEFIAAKNLLGVVDPPEKSMPKKYWALKRLANSLNAVTQPAPVTVDLDLCTQCGNCNTGCNVGAKMTLPFTVLRKAQKCGAEIFTGASVLTVHRCADDQAWTVRFRRTATAKTILKCEIYQIRAKIVILAAGTLGTTEILLRSAKDDLLPCSDRQLGKHFSSNGDMIAFGYAGRHPVHATGKPSDRMYCDPGPTISGYASVSFGFGAKTRPVVMQDSSVPLALNQIFGEIGATGSLLARYALKDRPAWFVDNHKKNPDPLAVNPGAIANSQVVLAMGHDGANGAIELVVPKDQADAKDNARVIVKWPDAWKDPVFESLHDKFKEAFVKGGFDDGYYIPNPAWKSVPDGFEKAFTGGAPAGKLLTVHPLGGCSMADSAENGVVNHLGQVFKSNHGRAAYDDLYVMDGAILPEALGVNPFLTISALALRSSHAIRKSIECSQISFEQIPKPCDFGERRKTNYGLVAEDPFSTKALDDRPIKMEVRERLARFPGALPMLTIDQYDALIDYANHYVISKHAKDANNRIASKGAEEDLPFKKNRYYRLVLSIEATFDLNAFLADPEGTPLTGDATLSFDPSQSAPKDDRDSSGQRVNNANCGPHSLFVEPIVTEHLVPIACGKCRVALLVRDDAKFGQQMRRWMQTARAACSRRSGDFSLKKILENGSELMLTVSQHTHWRRFDYRLDFDRGALVNTLNAFTLEGKKLLAYTEGNPWNALFKMDINLHAKAKDWNLGAFHVDLNHLLKDGIPQVKQSPHMPATLMGVARFGLFALRAIFQTHLWSFGAPTYDKHVPLPPALPEAITLPSRKACRFSVVRLEDPDLNNPPGKSFNVKPYIRLARYVLEERIASSATTRHLLLIHGLAHGGAVFATPTITTPMVAYFVEQGYVVWVLDHRLSPALEWQPHRRPVTMDDLAKTDIRIAVNHVYNAAGGKPIDVFAHCIGAGAFAMAALKGCLHDNSRNQSKIKRATIHAVTPWLVASPKNAANAKLAAFYKDSLRFDDPSEAGFDPIPPTETKTEKPDFFEVLIDRIGGSIPWASDETKPHQAAHSDIHMSRAVCDRMTLWYSYGWNHKNLAEETHNKIGSLVGFGNLAVFRHIYFCILRQRLTDREGNNVYLTVDNIEDHWPFDTMFIHGLDNQVFAPAGSKSSAWKLTKNIEVISTDKDRGRRRSGKQYKKPTVWRCDIVGYGHMDLLFGKNAWTHVYPHVHQFFLDALCPSGSAESVSPCSPVGSVVIEKNPVQGSHSGLPGPEPRLGPVFFNPKQASGGVKINAWLEPITNSTSEATDAVYQTPPLEDLITPYAIAKIPSKYFYGKYWINSLKVDIKSIAITPIVGYAEAVPYVLRKAPLVPAETSSWIPTRLEPRPLNWLTKLADNKGKLAFALGSCRYPGSPFEKDASDRLFAAILAQANDWRVENALDFAMFVGDQIYADATANVFDTTEVVERYWERYRNALGSKNMKELLNYLPTYFALDDHEFDDNWLGGETLDPKVDPKKAEQYQYARDAARSYQGMAGYRGNENEYKFWYQFKTLGYPFFVMDTRTQRKIRRADTRPEHACIVNPEQWSELTNWLDRLTQYRGPKFIACGVTVAPPLEETFRHGEAWRNDDSWLGFPGSLALLVEYIVSHDIQNVVLIGGDLHLSAYASMTFKANGKTTTVHQIVASGLYVPLPFGNTKSRDLGHGLYKIPGSEYEIDFDKPQILTTSPSHFVRVDVKPRESGHQILIQAYDDKALGDSVLLCTI